MFRGETELDGFSCLSAMLPLLPQRRQALCCSYNRLVGFSESESSGHCTKMLVKTVFHGRGLTTHRGGTPLAPLLLRLKANRTTLFKLKNGPGDSTGEKKGMGGGGSGLALHCLTQDLAPLLCAKSAG
jgi:hypothetical protein